MWLSYESQDLVKSVSYRLCFLTDDTCVTKTRAQTLSVPENDKASELFFTSN
jgi:hypothetical protein